MSEPCDSSDPCDIVTAVNGATGTDDVTLLGGSAATYSITTALTIADGVTVHGAPGARPLIESSVLGGNTTVTLAGPNSVLRDVSVSKTEGNGTAVNSLGGTIERVHARSNGHQGCAAGPGSLIRDSVCWTTSSSLSAASGLEAFSGPGAATVTVRNVTAVATAGSASGLRMQVVNPTANLTVNATNVIADSAGGSDVSSFVNPCCVGGTGAIVLDHSNYDSESEHPPITITDPGTGTNNETTEPMFLDAANGDFRQAETSTGTINQGVAGVVNGFPLGALDLDGLDRFEGPAPDIGAHEVPSPVTTPPQQPANPTTPTNPVTPTQPAAKKCKKKRKRKAGAGARKCKRKKGRKR